jgi:thiol:disulfide interchange protein DsbD
MVGALTGGSSVTDPLYSLNRPGVTAGPGSLPTAVAQDIRKLPFVTIKSSADLKREMDNARAAGKTVMLDFYADWCTYCKQFETYVFTDESVQQAIVNTVLLKADVTLTDDTDKALMKEFGVFLPPAILFFDKNSQEVREERVIGFVDAAEFRRRMERALR